MSRLCETYGPEMRYPHLGCLVKRGCKRLTSRELGLERREASRGLFEITRATIPDLEFLSIVNCKCNGMNAVQGKFKTASYVTFRAGISGPPPFTVRLYLA